jgi:signal transduction histidine kinase
VFALGATLGYYFGFAPPQFLRHVWQEPELRAFLSRTVRLTQLLDIAAIVHELEQATAAAVGTPHATIGLWDENQRSMHFLVNGQLVQRAATDDSPAIQVFETQRSLFVPDVLQAYPARAASSRAYGAKSLLAAPITADNHRLGVLLVYAPYAPIFANDDLTLLQILAGQAAVLLESRALMDEAARVRAHDEATRLKDDFLSAAAHDLKTPITTLLVKAQLLERRAMRNPEAPTDVAGLRVLVQEAQRLRRLVLELLDAARAEQGRLVGDRAEVDLVPIVQMVGARHETRQHHIRIDAPTALVGIYDDVRIEQLFENLLENAVKYSPGGGSIDIKLWSEQEQARLTVSDQGIGVPPQDLASIFDRFYRAGNANERQYVGMGLGLFICRGIVEQHGGQIVVTSTPGIGTTFSVTLPLTPVEAGIADS